MRQLSDQVPQLHIIDAEDHELNFSIFYQRKSVCSLRVFYGMEGQFYYEVGCELYGDDEYIMNCTDSEASARVEQEVQKRQHEINEKITSFFTDRLVPDQFKLFGFDQAVCDQIAATLTPEKYQQDRMGHEIEGEFLAVIGIQELQFISHHYVAGYEDEYKIIAKG